VSAPDLSLRGALKLIQKRAPSSDGALPVRPKPIPKKKAASSFDALRWCSSSTPEERRHFLDGVGRRAVEAATPPAWRGHGDGLAANMVVATTVPTVKLTKKEKLEAARVKFEFVAARLVESDPETARVLHDALWEHDRPVWELVAALGRNLGLEEADDDAPDEPEPMPAADGLDIPPVLRRQAAA
jgi:hypothetical protein